MSGVDFAKINSDIYEFINQARSGPESFIQHINARIGLIDDRNSFLSNGIRYRLKEGQIACGELKVHMGLLAGSPISQLKRSEGLDRAAKQLAEANGISG